MSTLVRKKIFVGGVNRTLTADDLVRALCMAAGQKQDDVTVHLALDWDDQSLGYAVLTVPARASADFLKLNGSELCGRVVSCRLANEQPLPKPARWRVEENGVSTYLHSVSEEELDVKTNFRYHLIDSGVYLADPLFQPDMEAVVARSLGCGIEKMIVKSRSIEEGQQAAKLASIFQGHVFFLVGVHPSQCKTWTSESVATLRELLNTPGCVGIGECGLDFTWDEQERDLQLQVFEEQVSLACETKKPLVIYEKNAHEQIWLVLERYAEKGELPPTAIYTYSKDRAVLDRYLARNYYIVITGFTYTWPYESPFSALLKANPSTEKLAQILLASNSPGDNVEFVTRYLRNNRLIKLVHEAECMALTPKSLDLFQNLPEHRNEPSSQPCLLELVAAQARLSPEEMAELCFNNALHFFQLSGQPAAKADRLVYTDTNELDITLSSPQPQEKETKAESSYDIVVDAVENCSSDEKTLSGQEELGADAAAGHVDKGNADLSIPSAAGAEEIIQSVTMSDEVKDAVDVKGSDYKATETESKEMDDDATKVEEHGSSENVLKEDRADENKEKTGKDQQSETAGVNSEEKKAESKGTTDDSALTPVQASPKPEKSPGGTLRKIKVSSEVNKKMNDYLKSLQEDQSSPPSSIVRVAELNTLGGLRDQYRNKIKRFESGVARTPSEEHALPEDSRSRVAEVKNAVMTSVKERSSIFNKESSETEEKLSPRFEPRAKSAPEEREERSKRREDLPKGEIIETSENAKDVISRLNKMANESADIPLGRKSSPRKLRPESPEYKGERFRSRLDSLDSTHRTGRRLEREDKILLCEGESTPSHSLPFKTEALSCENRVYSEDKSVGSPLQRVTKNVAIVPIEPISITRDVSPLRLRGISPERFKEESPDVSYSLRRKPASLIPKPTCADSTPLGVTSEPIPIVRPCESNPERSTLRQRSSRNLYSSLLDNSPRKETNWSAPTQTEDLLAVSLLLSEPTRPDDHIPSQRSMAERSEPASRGEGSLADREKDKEDTLGLGYKKEQLSAASGSHDGFADIADVKTTANRLETLSKWEETIPRHTRRFVRDAVQTTEMLDMHLHGGSGHVLLANHSPSPSTDPAHGVYHSAYMQATQTAAHDLDACAGRNDVIRSEITESERVRKKEKEIEQLNQKIRYLTYQINDIQRKFGKIEETVRSQRRRSEADTAFSLTSQQRPQMSCEEFENFLQASSQLSRRRHGLRSPRHHGGEDGHGSRQNIVVDVDITAADDVSNVPTAPKTSELSNIDDASNVRSRPIPAPRSSLTSRLRYSAPVKYGKMYLPFFLLFSFASIPLGLTFAIEKFWPILQEMLPF